MNEQRLQKVLASAGIASRRDCEAMIAAGRVAINGQVVHEVGVRVNIDSDVVSVDGTPITLPDSRTYIMLNKPVGVVSTVEDPQGRPTVIDLINSSTRIFPVGRLDIDSEGLLLLTNDGELAHRLTHPRFATEKEYQVLLDRTPDHAALQAWRTGSVLLEGKPTAPARVAILNRDSAGTWIRVVLQEGRKRQIREVARSLGYTVLRLIRVREDSLLLADLPAGQWRVLLPEEVAALRSHANLTPPADEKEQAVNATSRQRTPTGSGRTTPARPTPNRAWRERQEEEKRLRQQRSGSLYRTHSDRKRNSGHVSRSDGFPRSNRPGPVRRKKDDS